MMRFVRAFALAVSIPSLALAGTTSGPITGFNSINVQKFTSSGTYTPSAGLIYAEVHCQGAGAGGGGIVGSASAIRAGGGGGAGSESVLFASAATIGASQTVTIGTAGAGGAAGANIGVAGGDTSLGSLCIGKGGSGGEYSDQSTQFGIGGAGGVAGTGTLTFIGQDGAYAAATAYYNAGLIITGGPGGTSKYGTGGINSQSSFTGQAAKGYGSGGQGGSASSVATNYGGGAGTGGLLYVIEYLNH